MSEPLRCPVLHHRGRALSLDTPRIMGILNITPDSFSDGGRYFDASVAVDAAHRMITDGADIIDVGGESTRPGADPVPLDQELERVLPVVEALCAEGMLVSVDTSKAGVMTAAVEAGAFMINDVAALRAPGALAAAAESQVPVCLMHMLGEPRTMQHQPVYGDVVADIREFLADRINACVDAGISRGQIIVDPGFGFGKTVRHNLSLMERLQEFEALSAPVLVGISRKSLFGKLLDLDVGERVHASVAAALICVERGASVVRVHDVRETAQALGVWRAMKEHRKSDET